MKVKKGVSGGGPVLEINIRYMFVAQLRGPLNTFYPSEILVLAGTAGAGRMALPASTRISAG